jgi:hypothetical protein
MTLSVILSDSGKQHEAAELARTAASTSEDAYGCEDIGTLEARNYLAYVLFQAGLFEEVIKLQEEVMAVKAQVLGHRIADRTYAVGLTMLLAAHSFLDHYAECLSIANDLLEAQLNNLGSSDPEVLTTRFWICRARLGMGDMDGLLEDTRQLRDDYEGALGRSEDVQFAEEFLSGLLLALAKPDPTAATNEDFLEESLDIMVALLDEIEGAAASTDESSRSSRRSGSMDTDTGGLELEPEDEVMSDAEPARLRPVNKTLFLLTHTTWICIMGFKKDFGVAQEYIEFVASDTFLDTFPGYHVDALRFNRVAETMRELKGLVEAPISTEGTEDRISYLLWRLAHRWIPDTA